MKKKVFLLSLIPFLIIIGFSIFSNYRDGYFYYHESGKYLVNYLTDKPIAAKLFDYRQHDAEFYRPRELGNVFNLLDAYAVYFFAVIGLPHFLSPVHYLSMFIIAMFPVLYVISRKNYTYASVGIAVLMGLIYLTSPAPFYTTYYFRTSKGMIGVFTVLYFLLIQKLQNKHRWSGTIPLGIFLLTIAMGTTDELGIILVALFFIYHLLTALIRRDKQYGSVVTASFLGIGGILVYRKFVSPWITQRVVGFPPPLWGDALPTTHDLVRIREGADVLFSYLGYLLGGLDLRLLLVCIVVVGFVLTHAFYQSFLNKTVDRSFLVVLFSFSLVLTFLYITFFSGILLMMINNLSWIAMKELRLAYYPLPFVTLWFALIVVAVFHTITIIPKSKHFFSIIFLLIIGINLFRLPEYKMITKVWWKSAPYYGAAFPLISAINAETIKESAIVPIDGREVIYLFRKKLGKPILYGE